MLSLFNYLNFNQLTTCIVYPNPPSPITISSLPQVINQTIILYLQPKQLINFFNSNPSLGPLPLQKFTYNKSSYIKTNFISHFFPNAIIKNINILDPTQVPLHNLNSITITNPFLTEIPSFFQQASHLTTIKLHKCHALVTITFPDHISLKKIVIIDCFKLETVNIPSTNTLIINNCHMLSTINLTSPSNLKSIILTNLFSLRNVTSLTNCVNLKNIHILSPITEFDLTNLTNLRRITLPFKITTLDIFSKNTKLKLLKLSNGIDLININALSNFPNLQTLHLYKCYKLSNIDVLINCSKLKTLILMACNLMTIPPLPTLTNLSLSYCTPPHDPTFSQNIFPPNVLTSLKQLTLNKIPLKNYDMLSKCIKLKNLTLIPHKTVENFHSLQFLKYMTNLHTLELEMIHNLTNLDELTDIKSLRSIKLVHCDNLININALSKCPNLTKLCIHNCDQTNLSSLQECDNLKYLEIQNGIIFDLGICAKYKTLYRIVLKGCVVLKV